MRLAIMQPYLFPYQGYYNLMSACDVIVIRDRVQYSKGGWVNRNQLEVNNDRRYFTIPLEQASDYAMIAEKQIVNSWTPLELRKVFTPWLAGAPFRSEVIELNCLNEEATRETEYSLFRYLLQTIVEMQNKLQISCQVLIESEILPGDPSKGQDGVIQICQKLGADEYLNLPGGRSLYSAPAFKANGLKLKFLQPQLNMYCRGTRPWIESLSILDSVAFLGFEETGKRARNDYALAED